MSGILVLLIFASVLTIAFPLEISVVEDDYKNQLENLAEQLKDVKNENTVLKQELSFMKQEMDQRLTKLEGNTHYGRNKEKRLMEGNVILPAVAFSASLSKNVNLADAQTVEYDTVLTNTGNHYSPLHGVFTAPYSGIYLFSATLFTIPQDYVHLYIEKNGIDVAYLYSHSNGWDQASQTVILELSKGDEVWIRHKPAYDQSGHNTLAAGYNTFSGVLVNVT